MSGEASQTAAAENEATGAGGPLRALSTVFRWIGCWIASGLLIFAGLLVVWRLVRSMEWNSYVIGWSVGTSVAGILLAALLWRRRRDRDGTVAAMVLTAGFWVAIWVLIWPRL